MASPFPRLQAGPTLPRMGDRISGEGRWDVWIECEKGLDSVPEFAYKGTSRTRDEEWRCGDKRGSKRDKSR
ncbi:hypothetical protein M405DRAFT_820889 [Rhizopogon salebrosus TDB-379]|nr:hypothetical protein M405DRAFT_820889 [Rhizopogon salebrosus TDB-379]